MIYFAQSPDGGTIKIGCSVNVPVRIKQLESHYGQPLALLATIPGGREEERAIHERFAAHRMGRTEQFRPVAEIMAFIGRPLLVSPDPDAVEVMDEEKRDGVRQESIVVRMSAEFKDWLERFAARERVSLATVVELCLAATAKDRGFEDPPRR